MRESIAVTLKGIAAPPAFTRPITRCWRSVSIGMACSSRVRLKSVGTDNYVTLSIRPSPR